jgi:hypothetical protein
MNSKLRLPVSYRSKLTGSERKFAAVEAASEKMLKDSVIFRDSVQGMSNINVTIEMDLIYRPPHVWIELWWFPCYPLFTYGSRVQLGRETSQCSGYCPEYCRLPAGNGGIER